MSDRHPPRHLKPEPEAYDYTDPEAARSRAAESSLKDDRLREVEAAILSTPQGREWVWGILTSLHAFEQRITMTGSDYENGIFVGEHFAGTRLLASFAEGSPENFGQMLRENRGRS